MKLLWRAKMSTIQNEGEEVEEGAVYHVTLKRVQIQQAANKGARWLGAEGDQLAPEHTVSQYETCKIRTIKAGTLEKLVENLLTAFGDNDFTYISIFFSTYRAFASTKDVLDLLLGRYGNLETSSCEEVGNQNSSESKTVLRPAIASILRAWLDQCSEDFKEPPEYPCLLKLLDYLKTNIPGSDPERRAQNLLEQFQNQEVENKDGFLNNPTCNPSDEEALENSNLEDFSFFQEDLVAEQLTYMDAELFKKVVPYHCLGRIWSQRDKKENKHLAPTIRATISQFNAVTRCVISTILENKEMKTQQRAKIVEKWIHIAHILEAEKSFAYRVIHNLHQECRILKNFSSLRAIISALQSNSIYRLKKTWACVPKDISLMFEELSDIFSDHDNYLTSRELLMKEGTSKFANFDSNVKENQKKTQRRLQLQKDMGVMQGTVPYLGTFLTDLTMLDTALQDSVEGGLINFEKKRREFEVIAQIKLLQSSCNSYCMTPDEKFIQWFKRQQHLTEEESYNLSRQIEAAADASTTSPKPRKSVVKRFSLMFLGSEVIAHSTPTKEQPKSPPTGSSGESTDSASVSSCEFNHPEYEEVTISPIGTPHTKLSDSSAPDPSAPEPSTPEPPAPEPSAPEPSAPEPSAPEPSAPEPSAPEPSGPEPSAPEPSAPEPSAPEPPAPEPSSHEYSAPQPSAPEASSLESSSTEPSSPEPSSPESSSPPSFSVDISSSGVSSFISTPSLLFSNNECPASATAVTSPAEPPVYNKQNKDMCIIHTSVEDDNGNVYKSILLTSQDKAPAVIQRAMLKHNLDSDTTEDYELVQVISEQKELVIPANANVFYAMNSHVNFDFILRKKSAVNRQVKMKNRCSVTFPRNTKRGNWSNSKITL